MSKKFLPPPSPSMHANRKTSVLGFVGTISLVLLWERKRRKDLLLWRQWISTNFVKCGRIDFAHLGEDFTVSSAFGDPSTFKIAGRRLRMMAAPEEMKGWFLGFPISNGEETGEWKWRKECVRAFGFFHLFFSNSPQLPRHSVKVLWKHFCTSSEIALSTTAHYFEEEEERSFFSKGRKPLSREFVRSVHLSHLLALSR